VSQPPTLEYRSLTEPEPLPPARRVILYRIGLLCWIVPLIIGVADFLAWLISRREFFVEAGVWIVGGGTAIAFVGGVCGLVFVITRWKRSGNKKREVILPALGLIGLLASNFGVAFLLIALFAEIAKPFDGL
jgi:uncharacterized membrane protein